MRTPTKREIEKLEKKWRAKGEDPYVRCPICTKTIIRTRPWTKYCSDACRNEGYWKTHKVVEI